jgi:hypothetical protein
MQTQATSPCFAEQTVNLFNLLFKLNSRSGYQEPKLTSLPGGSDEPQVSNPAMITIAMCRVEKIDQDRQGG